MCTEDEIIIEGAFKRMEEIFSSAKNSIREIKIKVNKEFGSISNSSIIDLSKKTGNVPEYFSHLNLERGYKTLSEELKSLSEKINYNLDELNNKICEELAVRIGRGLQTNWKEICFQKEEGNNGR